LVEAVVIAESQGKADAFRWEPAFYERYLKENPLYAGWEPRRVSSSYGLMQVMYPTAVQHGFKGEPEELFKIDTNLAVGCSVLSRLLRKYTDPLEALAAYNGGAGGIKRPGPKAYAKRVFSHYTVLKEAHAA